MKRLINKNSAKQVGIIYHYTRLIDIINILRTDKIDTHPVGGDFYDDEDKIFDKWAVSFTRNQNFHQITRPIGGTDCRITFDGNKLSENHKIEPLHDTHYFSDEDFGTEKMQQEEIVVCTGEAMSPIKPYIISVDFDKTKLDSQEMYKKLIILKIQKEFDSNFEFNIDDQSSDELANILKTYIEQEFSLNVNFF
ncbi:MAG: hypothetical protein ACOCP8_06880 [archaeon]